MSDGVENSEDRFSRDMADIETCDYPIKEGNNRGSDQTAWMCLFCSNMQNVDFLIASSTKICVYYVCRYNDCRRPSDGEWSTVSAVSTSQLPWLSLQGSETVSY